MDFVVFADLRPASQIGMRHDSRATLDPNRAFDDHVRSNLDFGVDCGLGIDNSGRMNAHENELLVPSLSLHVMTPLIHPTSSSPSSSSSSSEVWVSLSGIRYL